MDIRLADVRAAREAIARSRGIKNILQQITRHHEVLITVPENGAVFATFDDKSFRAHFDDAARRLA